MAVATRATSTKHLSLRALALVRENPNFALLMLGRVTSNMGRSARVFARAWIVLELTGSPFLLGLVTSSLSWPMLVMPFVGGVLADRMDRRKLLIWTEGLLTILWLAVSVDIAFGWIRWWHLAVSGIGSGVIQSVGRPGHDAMVGSVVAKEDLPAAVAVDNIVDHWPRAIGLVLATFGVALIGVRGIFWGTAILQGITVMAIVALKWNGFESDVDMSELKKKSGKENLVEGIKAIGKEPVLIGLTLMAATATLFAGSYGFLMPFFARDILGVGATGFGTMQLAGNIGTSIGAAAVMFFIKPGARGKMLLFTTMAYAVLIISFSRSTTFVLSLSLVFLMGMMSTVTRTVMLLMMQMLAQNEFRGRVMSIRVFIQGLSWIGVLIMGAVAQFAGPQNTILIGASIYAAITLVWFVTRPTIWRLK